MKYMGQKRWLSGGLVAGLVLAAVVSGSGEMAQVGGYRVQKSDFHLTESIQAFIGNDMLSAATVDLSAGQTVVQTNIAAAQGIDSANVAAAQGGGSGTITAGRSSTITAGESSTITAGGSSTITAGSGQGPSVYGNLVTEGEKAQQGIAVPQEQLLGGATLTMLDSQSSSQMLSAILQTSQGSLIVVDGGLGDDGDYLKSQILARGGHVSAWLITHPHGDHVGALYKILQDEASGNSTGITIDGIYYSFASPEWYKLHDVSESTMAVSIIGTFAGLPDTMLHQVSRGQTIQVDDVTILVMNDRYELGSDTGNNAGIVYKLYVNGKSILFLGDMAYEGGNRLLSDLGAEALKSDIVQMAHHGQNGVGQEVYQAIDPSVCLWPTPEWLWNNSGNSYRITETKGWISRLNVQQHYCTKDGDQTIR